MTEPKTETMKPQTLEEWRDKCREMLLLLIECRDALPAISLTSAKLHGIDLNLDKKIEACLEPWESKDGTGI